MSTRYCGSCLNTFASDPTSCPNMGCGRQRPRGGWGRILGPGDLIDRHYRVDRVLALGGAGLTYLARAVDASGRPQPPELAIKVLFAERATGSYLRRLANEAQLLQDLDHEHVVRCRGFVQRAGQAPYLVTLFESGGSLQQHLQRVGQLHAEVACSVLAQVLDGLDAAHRFGVVHRDLKPANVLLAEPTPRELTPWVRVADFGIAKVQAAIGAGLTQAGTFVGTPEYAAPEQFEGLQPQPATDIFAAGGLLYFLLTGRPPVQLRVRGDPLACYEILLEQLPPRLPPLSIPATQQARLQHVIDGVMVPSANKRWGVEQILDHIGHLVRGPEQHSHQPAPTAIPAEQDSTTMVGYIATGEPTIPKGRAAPPPPPGDDLTILEPLPTPEPSRPRAEPVHWTPPSPTSPPAEPPPAAAPAAPAPPAQVYILYNPTTRPPPPPPPPRGAPPARAHAPPPPPPPPRRPPPPAASPAEPAPLSLDDLFSSASSSPARRPGPAAPAAPPAPPPSSDPFDTLTRKLSALEPEDPFSSLAPRGAARRRKPAPTPAAPAEPAAPAPEPEAGLWRPPAGRALPQPLPSSPGELLALLGEVRAEDRAPIIASLQRLDRYELARSLRAWRAGSDARGGRGVGLAIAALGGADLAAVARNLVRAKEPTVRCCAAEALGAVAAGSLLSTLARMLEDPEPAVRACAARAIGHACQRTGDAGLGRSWLQRIEKDADQAVARARKQALQRLGG